MGCFEELGGSEGVEMGGEDWERSGEGSGVVDFGRRGGGWSWDEGEGGWADGSGAWEEGSKWGGGGWGSW